MNPTIQRGDTESLISLWESIPESTRQDGRDWYPYAQSQLERLARMYRVPYENVAAATSAISPLTRWNQNLANIERMLEAQIEITNVAMFIRNAEKGWNLLYGRVDPLDAFKPDTKTYNFYLNLMGEYWAVTLDTWMIRALGLTKQKSLTPKQYRYWDTELTIASVRVGELPAHMQAGIWIHTRGKADSRG